MLEDRIWTGLERRLPERIPEDSILVVNTPAATGAISSKATRDHDLSSQGISFLLGRAVEKNSMLDLQICSPDEPAGSFLPAFRVTARGMRVSPLSNSDGCYHVAAQFCSAFTPLREVVGIEEMAKALRQAIEINEEQRQTSKPVRKE